MLQNYEKNEKGTFPLDRRSGAIIYRGMLRLRSVHLQIAHRGNTVRFVEALFSAYRGSAQISALPIGTGLNHLFPEGGPEARENDRRHPWQGASTVGSKLPMLNAASVDWASMSVDRVKSLSSPAGFVQPLCLEF